MPTRRLVKEIRIYFYSDNTQEMREIKIVKRGKDRQPRKRRQEITPGTIVRCPRCGTEFSIF